MELVERNHKIEQTTANEQIRKMRKFIGDLQAQLNIVNRNLQVSQTFTNSVKITILCSG